MRIPTPPIVVCSQWGARKPKHKPVIVGRPDKILIHHTDGHALGNTHPPSDALTQAKVYARMLQNDMMDRRGWNDTGQNFTVMRSGIILQGRWGTVTAIERGRMVESAHCPYQNDQPGIEHEHVPGEELTPRQHTATVWLMAWICDRTAIRCTELYGHNKFYDTACPSNLTADIRALRLDVAVKLRRFDKHSPKWSHSFAVNRAIRAELSA